MIGVDDERQQGTERDAWRHPRRADRGRPRNIPARGGGTRGTKDRQQRRWSAPDRRGQREISKSSPAASRGCNASRGGGSAVAGCPTGRSAVASPSTNETRG